MNARARRIGIAAIAILAGAALSCTSDQAGPAAVASKVPATTSKLVLNSLLKCDAMEADSVTQEIGPEGGAIYFGSHKLTIPAGALDSTVSITAIAPSDTVNRVELYPEGLTFNSHAYLRLSYANCEGIGSWIPKSVVYLDELNIAEVLSSLDVFWLKRVTGSIEHFSGYAVAW